MAVTFFEKRLFSFLHSILAPHPKHPLKLKKYILTDFRRHLSCRNYHKKSTGSVLYKVNLAQFYNGSKPVYNVSTYDNLVKQKSGIGDEKCQGCKDHPGRHKFHREIECALNDQIEMEFNASFAYLSMASYYGRSEVALPGCQGFFMMMHQEEHEHAIIFLNYVLMRGGHVCVPCIGPPDNQDWKDISKTFATACQLESQVKEKLEDLVVLSEKHKDHQLVDFISGEFLEEQNRSIQTLARLFTRSKMVANNDVGEHLFDQHVFDSFVKQSKDNLMYKIHLPTDEPKEVYK
ncbi:soma ferritin-like [Anthonomus grandis grandis]|uniref:soma ferritin-like n=1 Tax=Anthonomus grandis grandis TaxID=2921223 RepID=UPI0021665F66|nr:soma ferritin-like [Anthonomus grandis grandis]